MTNEEIEAELRHLATKADLADLKAEIQSALRTQFYWLILIQIALLSIAMGPIYFMLNQLLARHS